MMSYFHITSKRLVDGFVLEVRGESGPDHPDDLSERNNIAEMTELSRRMPIRSISALVDAERE